VQQKWDNCSHTALCSQVFSEDFQSNIYSNIFPCSCICSSCSHECYMQNTTNGTLRTVHESWNAQTSYNEINPLYHFCLNIPPQHCFYYPVTSYIAAEWQKQKFWTLAICIFYEQFFDLPQSSVLYSNLHALRYLFITFYSSWKVNISEHLISTMHITKKVNHFKNSTNFEFSNPFL